MISIEYGFADAHRSVVFIDDLSWQLNCAANLVEMRIGGGPQMRFLDADLLCEFIFFIRRNLLIRLCVLNDLAIAIENCGEQSAGGGSPGLIPDPGLDLQGCGIPRDLPAGNEGAPVGDV